MLVNDQIGESVKIPDNPKRIISLVPSQTELLYDLGLEERVVGITKFCVHPEKWFLSKTRIGGTKDVDIEKVKSLNPDLIIGNKEENTLKDVRLLREIAPVWISDVNDLNQSIDMIQAIGEICNADSQADKISSQITENFNSFNSKIKGKSVLYFIWKKPYMVAAKDTFIDSILTNQLGLKNLMSNQSRYPSIELNDISEEPDFIFLSSEPYPFKEKHKEEINALFPKAKVILVDGEYFSWYGSRLIGAPDYFDKQFNCL
jgi:ABC-type Fe3+-hydroxamate transport system substrate-binding protein